MCVSMCGVVMLEPTYTQSLHLGTEYSATHWFCVCLFVGVFKEAALSFSMTFKIFGNEFKNNTQQVKIIPHAHEKIENKDALTFGAMPSVTSEMAAQIALSLLYFHSFPGTHQHTKTNALEGRKYLAFGKRWWSLHLFPKFS